MKLKRNGVAVPFYCGADYETRSARFRARRHAHGRRNSPRLFLCFATAFSSLAILINAKKEAPKCFLFFMERITRLARLAFALADTHTAAETAPGCFFASQRPFRASNPYKRKKEAPKCFLFFMERITRLELATSTLARWRSTG